MRCQVALVAGGCLFLLGSTPAAFAVRNTNQTKAAANDKQQTFKILPPVLNPNATTSMYAYSIQTGPVAFGPNNVTNASLALAGVGKPAPTRTPVPNGILYTIKGVNTFYKPAVGVLNEPKRLNVGDNEFVTSVSGNFAGTGGQETIFDNAISANPISILYATATGPAAGVMAAGAAAGESFDPVTLSPGTSYPYTPMVDATLTVANPTDTAGVMFYATDTTVFGSSNLINFVDNGSTLDQALWHLSITAAAAGGSTGTPTVEFVLNPLALNELSFTTAYLTSLPGYSMSLTPDQVADLIDADLTATVAGMIVPDGAGDQVLSDASFFPAGTTITAAGSSSVDYAEGSEALVTAVPEPASLALLGAAMLVMARRTRRS